MKTVEVMTNGLVQSVSLPLDCHVDLHFRQEL